MNIYFIISVLVVLVGGSAFAFLKYDEYDDRFSLSFCITFTLLGFLTAGWGIYFHVTDTFIWSSKGGAKAPVSGGQLFIIGAAISCFSIYQIFRLIRKLNNKE